MVSKSTRELGFTLLELLVVIAIVSLLASIAIAKYLNYKVQAYDSVAQSDFKNAMSAAENYFLENDTFPSDPNDLLTNGFQFSKDVCFTKFTLESSGQSLHMHIMHTGSSSAWHTVYPDDGGVIERRDPKDCL